jgi:hypothetical protein
MDRGDRRIASARGSGARVPLRPERTQQQFSQTDGLVSKSAKEMTTDDKARMEQLAKLLGMDVPWETD